MLIPHWAYRSRLTFCMVSMQPLHTTTRAWSNAMYTNWADWLYVYLILSYIFFLFLFQWLSIVYCLTSPLQISDTYALCFPSTHKLHSVHTMFLFGCFIIFVPYTHSYEHIERRLPINCLHLNSILKTLNYYRWFCPQPICHPSYFLLCPHMHHDSPIIISPTRKQTLSRSKVSYTKVWASFDRTHLGATYWQHYVFSRQSAPRYPSSLRRRKWTDSSSGDQIIQTSSFIEIESPANPFLSGNILDKAPSPRSTSKSHHIRTWHNLMLCAILIPCQVYRSRLTCNSRLEYHKSESLAFNTHWFVKQNRAGERCQ
jgi:hypothetical protein